MQHNLLQNPFVASFALTRLPCQFVVAWFVIDCTLASETIATIFFLQRFATVVFLFTPVVARLDTV